MCDICKNMCINSFPPFRARDGLEIKLATEERAQAEQAFKAGGAEAEQTSEGSTASGRDNQTTEAESQKLLQDPEAAIQKTALGKKPWKTWSFIIEKTLFFRVHMRKKGSTIRNKVFM